MNTQIEQDARAWICDYLRNECGVNEIIESDRPIFEYLDSFAVVGFFMACEEQYPMIGDIDPGFFTGANIDEAARIIVQKLRPAATASPATA